MIEVYKIFSGKNEYDATVTNWLTAVLCKYVINGHSFL